MPNTAVRAAAEGMPSITRRLFLRNTASMGVVAATVAAPTAAIAANSPSAELDENPALIEAWRGFVAAENEHKAAKDALEWLADEWRHLWPLAPEEILGCANASGHGKWPCERDILGRPLDRDCAALTKRLSPKFRKEMTRICFGIDDPERLAEDIAYWEQLKPKGRTEKSLARNREWREKRLITLRNKLALSRQYHAEIAEVRERAGVEAAKARLKTAKLNFENAMRPVSSEPALTAYGLRLKADAILGAFVFYAITRDFSFFGDAYRLAESVMEFTEGAARS